ncbi:MAG: hypothetical protein EXX96DRAFT_571769 [Benjaminiella poitrasii]|nr:MAG: hypothetical protein EXX96DRAFT_571769 [Benjaminiella poitrasii]
MKFLKSLFALSSLVAGSVALNAATIAECPALTPRKTPAKDVTDLRIDDIKIVGALGDSIMAGFGMMGVDYEGSGIINISLVSEYRGDSYAIGGDTGAITLANFMKRYNMDIKGPSVLSHLASLCTGAECSFPLSLYRPLRDNLNAAQSGAMAVNLEYELDYLIPRMKSYILSTSYQNDWKMITIQIGSNDQCASCGTDSIVNEVTPEAYGKYVEAAIERIKAEVPKVIVNLFGTFKVSGVYPLTNGQAYCVPNGFLKNTDECQCFSSAENMAKMDAISDAYNQKLQAIADKYKGKPNGTFAVMYSPAPIDILSFPIDALSNIDCFHPSLKGHQWIAKTFWNQMFLNSASKPTVMKFQDNVKVYCPTDNDRLPTA